MNPRNPRLNSSGCKDLTAYEAVKNITKDEKRAHALIKILKYIIDLAGFDLIERIQLKNKSTGKEFK